MEAKKIDQNKWIEPQQSLTQFQILNIYTTGIQEERKGVEKIFDEIKKEHFSIW